MSKPLRVLMVEDLEDDALLLIRELTKGGYEPKYERVKTAETVRAALRQKSWDVILCDYKMPQFNGLAAIALLNDTGIDIPLIMVSGTIGEETAVECMRLGARDYIMKDNLSRLVPAIKRELKEAESRTERKRVEEMLKESKTLIEAVVENIPLMIFLKEATDLRFVIFNRAGEELLGYDRKVLLGKNNLDLFPPEQAAHFMANDREVLDGESGILDIPEEPIWTAKKGQRLLHTRKVCIRGADGATKHLLGISEDITERKRTEEALRESEEKYRWMLDNMADVITVMDMNLRFTYISPSIIRMRGYTAEEATAQTLEQALTPESLQISAKVFEEEMKLEASGTADPDRIRIVEVEQYRKDGSIVLMENHLSFMRDKAKKAVGIISVSRDVTDRKRAEKEIQSLARFPSENPNPVLRIARDGTLLYINQAGLSLLPEWHLQVGQAAPSMLCEAALQARETGSKQVLHLEHGQQVFTFTAGPVIADGYANIYGEDITERKRGEEELRHTLESLRKAVGTTIQVMASAVEARDPYTAGHQIRSADLARAIAMEMGLPQDKIDGIRVAGSIHDIGKLSIPAEILSKPTKLSEIEFSLIKEHARKGYEMLKDVESPWPLAQIVYQHHERMDGSGYPRNLKGEEILIEARILSVADVVEAMASHRPYRPGLGIDLALAEIEKNRGIFYDEAVTDACLRLFREKGFKLERA